MGRRFLVPAAAGTVSTCVLALVGNSPARGDRFLFWPWLPPLSGASIGYGWASLVARAALLLVIGAWLGLGVVARREQLSARVLGVVAGVWSLPLLLSPPGSSNDLYAYVASGRLQSHGLDPYLTGPQALGGGEAVLHVVSHSWQDTPSPYGPGFLLITRGLAGFTGQHYLIAIVLLRLLMVAALGLSVWCAVQLARSRGRSERWVVWLLALNPLMLTTVVSAGHNDILMVAFVLAGFLLHERGHTTAAVALMVLGLEVKVVAIVGIVVLAVHAWRSASWREALRLGAVGALGTVVVTCAMGLPLRRGLGGGWGWLHALGVPGRSVSALTPVDAWWDLFRGAPPAPGTVQHQVWNQPFMTQVRVASLACAAIACAVVVVRRARTNPEAATAAVFGVVAVAGSVLWPWYFVWPLALLAIAGSRTQVGAVVAFSTGTMLALGPGGPIDWGKAGSLIPSGLADLITVLAALVVLVVLIAERMPRVLRAAVAP